MTCLSTAPGKMRRSKRFKLISWLLAFLFTFVLATSWGIAHENHEPIKDWQLQAIMTALDDSVPLVWAEALSKLAQYDLQSAEIPEDRVKQIVKLLDDEYSYVRSSAAQALGRMGEVAKAAVPNLIALLEDDDSFVRGSAASALGSMGEAAKPYIPNLIELLDDDRNVRGSAALALGSMGEVAKPYIPNLIALLKIALLKDDDSSVRSSSAQALGSMGEAAKDAVPTLIPLLEDDNVSVRSNAALALGSMGEAAKAAIPKLIESLDDKAWLMTYGAPQALGSMGEVAKDAVPNLIALLDDDDSSVRSDAASALGRMGAVAKAAIPNLIVLLDDDRYVSGSAAYALGRMGEAAKAAIPKLIALLDHGDSDVRSDAASALGRMGAVAKAAIPNLIALLDDDDSDVRRDAAYALGRMGEVAKDAVPNLIALLDDDDIDVRREAASALERMGKQDFAVTPGILSAVYAYPSEKATHRFLAYFLCGRDEDAITLIQWLGKPDKYPDRDKENIKREEGRKILEAFKKAWEPTKELENEDLRQDLERQIVRIVKQVHWKPNDIDILYKHYRNLKSVDFSNAAAINETILTLEGWKWFFTAWKIWLAHLLFWTMLIFAYPRFRPIQAIFFWNPWVRRFAGLGYVGFLLTWVPFLRRILFSPFQDSLLADAKLASLPRQNYFPQSPVTNQATKETNPLPAAIPQLQGQIILQGDSGLGKSMFLRHLAQTSQSITVYLPADRCKDGVTAAIQAKLHGLAKDANFLRNLIYSGAIDICIDGLNEVTSDTRAEIKKFVEDYFKGNIIMTTQPLDWPPPTTASVYELQPLAKDQIEEFLLSRPVAETGRRGDEETGRQEYERACREYLDTYLTKALREDQLESELDAARRILSNPMDLTVIAQMLATGKHPDLFNLQEQQYNLMAKEYKQLHFQEFPLAKFSEQVYQLRREGKAELPPTEFPDELKCMEKHKLVTSRQSVDGEGKQNQEWFFRHDKIMEYFITQTFLGDDNERPNEHLSDPQFRGVYFLLATLLPFDAAMELRETLILHAARTKDHTVSDTFVQLVKSRSTIPNA